MLGGTMPKSVTQALSEFAINPGFDRISADASHAARRCLPDYIGVAIAGAKHPASRKAREMLRRTAPGGGRCSLINSACQTDLANAAFANGLAAHVMDWDDTILPARAHFSATLFPPLMAIGETEGLTLEEIMPAFIVGFEIQTRISRAIYPSFHRLGWHTTAVIGAMGAAASVGRLIGCDGLQIAQAFAMAANSAGGLMSSFGSMSKAMNVSRAASAGLQSAYLASLGCISHDAIFETGGFLTKFDDSPNLDCLTDGLGEPWAVLENGFKLYPCGFASHAMIDAVRELREKSSSGSQLRRLTIRVSEPALQLMGKLDPKNELEAKFSLNYSAAVAWSKGNVTPADFEEEVIHASIFRKIMAVTEILSSDKISQKEAFAEAEYADGAKQSAHVRFAKGTVERPLDDCELIDKFLVASELGGVRKGRHLAELIMDGKNEAVRPLMHRLADQRIHVSASAENGDV
jgi:2-methylcitrate dehydratase PrpD